jgi:hypothetical protein
MLAITLSASRGDSALGEKRVNLTITKERFESASGKKSQSSLFCEVRRHGRNEVMKFRLLTHVLILGLFVTATMLAALVAPAKAGYARMDSETMAEMSAEMPCCPNPKDKQPDCTTNCPVVSFCLAKCFASVPTASATVVQAVVAVLALAGNEALRISRPAEPPARPPRS